MGLYIKKVAYGNPIIRDGHAFLWTSRSSNFPSRSTFPRAHGQHSFRVPPLSRSYFAFQYLCSSPISSMQLPVKLRYNGGGGGLVSSECRHLGVLVLMCYYGGGGGIITTGPYLTTADGQSCFTECTVCGRGQLTSSLHRNANLAFPFFRVPRSCIKFAFPRARGSKMPGSRECETRNARPSLPIISSHRNINT